MNTDVTRILNASDDALLRGDHVIGRRRTCRRPGARAAKRAVHAGLERIPREVLARAAMPYHRGPVGARELETTALQEFFNLFNHPQFDDPYVSAGNHPQSGKITSASDYGYNPSERIIQFGLKYNF